jgi:hypothetical protein
MAVNFAKLPELLRTRTADRLGISIRSLRDRIRNYRDHGESVPDSSQAHRAQSTSCAARDMRDGRAQ